MRSRLIPQIIEISCVHVGVWFKAWARVVIRLRGFPEGTNKFYISHGHNSYGSIYIYMYIYL